MTHYASIFAAITIMLTPSVLLSQRPIRNDDIYWLTAHKEPVRSIALSPDGKILATGSYDTTIVLWNTATKKQIGKLAGHTNWIHDVDFGPDGKRLASAGGDGTVRVWDVKTGKELLQIKGIAGRVFAVAFSPNGKWIAAGGLDSAVSLWSAKTGKLRWRQGHHTAFVSAITFSPDGKFVYAGSHDETASCCDVLNGNVVRTFRGHKRNIYSIAISPDGKTLATGSMDRTIRLWETASGKVRKIITGHANTPMGLAFFHDGRTVASGSADQTVRLWEVCTGKQRHRWDGHAGTVFALDVSPHSRFVATGSEDSKARIWAVAKKNPTIKKPAKLSKQQLQSLWLDLSGEDAEAAFEAIWKFAAAAPQSLPFLKKHLLPKKKRPVDKKRVQLLIRDLGSKIFRKREKAMAALALMGSTVEADLRSALRKKPTLEVHRRIKLLLAKLPTDVSHNLPFLRSIEVLEMIGDTQAAALLKELAQDPRELIRSQARASIARMAK